MGTLRAIVAVAELLLALPEGCALALDVPAELRGLMAARRTGLPVALPSMEVASFAQPRYTVRACMSGLL